NYVIRAEAAADNAFVNADIYPDVATGRAAVADGEQFQVLAANGYEYIRYRRDSPGVSPEVGRFRGASAPEYGFLSTSSSYSPLDLDSSSRTVIVRGRVVTGTRSFNIPEPVTLSFAEFQSTAFIVASSEVGGTRLVTSLVGIGAGEVIVGSIYPS